MRDLFKQFLDHDISRREFAKGLTSLGLSTAAVHSVVSSLAQAAEPLPRDGVKVEGTGAQILWETVLAADAKYVFWHDRNRHVADFRRDDGKAGRRVDHVNR